MLSAHPAVNPEVQGSKHAMDIFSFLQTIFVDDHILGGCDCMGHVSNLHKGQIHVLVLHKTNIGEKLYKFGNLANYHGTAIFKSR